MDIMEMVERFGISVCVAGACMWFVWKQTLFIQKFFMDDLQESQERLEKIIVTLISQQKELQIDIKESLADMRSSYESLVEIVQALSGNGLKKQEIKKKKGWLRKNDE
tara:strand:+ start:6656 stop:6979 length:324 start_codon:yes stop_codon:yes gene_type:complete